MLFLFTLLEVYKAQFATKLSLFHASLFILSLHQLHLADREAKDYKTPAPSTTNTVLPPPGLETTTAASLCSALNSRLL